MVKKTCSSCSSSQSADSFHKNKLKVDGLDIYCKECKKVRSAEYYKNKSPEIRMRNRKWANDNIDLRRIHRATRRGLETQARPQWLTSDQQTWIKWIYQQARRIELATGIAQHVDHIVPLNHSKVCGLDVPWNLQILSAKENIRKGNNFA